jgi:hypothetical protein
MTTPTIYPIYWGSAWKGAGFFRKSELNILMNQFSGSAWQGILSQYWGSNGFVSKTVTRATPYVDARVSTPQNLTQAAVRTEVEEAIGANVAAGWPQTPTVNDLFMVFTPEGATWAESGSFCGYHGRGGNYPFAYVGWRTPSGQSCSGSVTLAHEYAEAVTDPYPTEGWALSRLFREELVDVCGSERGTLGIWEVPKIEDNYLGVCSASDASPPQLAPEMITDTPTEVTASSATLKGHAVPHNVDISSYRFEWGQLSITEHRTPLTEFFPEEAPWNASAAISGLASKTTYKYRLAVSDWAFPNNTQRGEISEFTTP